MKKIFVIVFLATSLVGCSALSTVNAGGGDKTTNKDGTAVNINIGFGVTGKMDDLGTSAMGIIEKGNGNTIESGAINATGDQVSSLGLIKRGSKNKITAIANRHEPNQAKVVTAANGEIVAGDATTDVVYFTGSW